MGQKEIGPNSETLHRRLIAIVSLRHFPNRVDLEMERMEAAINPMFNILKIAQPSWGLYLGLNLNSPALAFFSL